MQNADLIIVVTDATGNTKTLSSDEPHPGDRPSGITFSSQAASGFYTASFGLSRQVDHESDDLHLLDGVTIVGTNGTVAYEGYIVEMPRSMDNTHTLTVSCAGWMAHCADETFSEIFVDRSLTNFAREPSATARATLVGIGLLPQGMATVTPDAAGVASLVQQVDRVAATKPIVQSWYDAGPGNAIGSVYAELTSRDNGGGLLGTPWVAERILMSDDTMLTGGDGGGSILGSYSGRLDATTDDRRYLLLQCYFNGVATVDGQWSATWRNLAVEGGHGLPRIGTAEPYGVAASDVIKYLAARYCPLLSTAGVQSTTYPISQLVFQDATPYDAFLRVNAYHQWQLAVWEGPTLHFGPADLTEWDWEIRHDEAENKIGLQGDSIEGRRAGIIVAYTDVATGQQERLHPDDHAELLDDDIANPWVQHGRRGFGEPYTIPFPVTAADALELGRVKLAEDNQITAPGQFTVQSRIKDRAGNWQPAWMVRSGQTIRLTSSASLSDRPRLIGEVNYSHDGATATITVDSTARYLDAYLDRMGTALAAANLQ